MSDKLENTNNNNALVNSAKKQTRAALAQGNGRAVADINDKMKHAIGYYRDKVRKGEAMLKDLNVLAVGRLDIIREVGQWLDENYPQGWNTSGLNNSRSATGVALREKPSFGVGQSTETKWRQCGKVDEEDYRTWIEEKENEVELTFNRLLGIYQRYYTRAPETPELPDGIYRVIYADPPWKYGNTMPPEYTTEQADYYPLMTIKELCDMPVKEMAADNAVLFMWVTSPILEEAFSVINAWGFKYKASFVWDKVKHNMGHYNSVRHEFLLICTRGSCTPDTLKLFDSVQSIERTKHSEKPEEFREIIDTIYPLGNRIELFARNKAEGWKVYGNDPSVS